MVAGGASAPLPPAGLLELENHWVAMVLTTQSSPAQATSPGVGHPRVPGGGDLKTSCPTKPPRPHTD